MKTIADKVYVPRVCAKCGKPRGTMAFRYKDIHDVTRRDYFHSDCFSLFLARIARDRAAQGD